MAVTTLAAHPVVATILRLLPLIDIAVVGLGALAFSLLLWADRGRSPGFASTLSRKEGLLLGAGHLLLGIALLASSVLLEDALAVRLAARGEGIASVSLCALLAFLGFSSLGLSWGALRSRPAPLLARVQAIFAALAAAILLALLLLPVAQAGVRRGIFLPGLAGIAIASAALSFWQHRRLIPGKGTGTGGGVQEGDRTRVLPDRGPPGFPADLLSRFSEPAAIGSGGVSRVFRARRREGGRIVAVKVPLAMDELTGKAFLREMRTWEELRHGNIVRILGANILPVPYVEMEYLPRSLGDLAKPTDIRTAAGIVAGIARGLAFAHARGIIHRDLKPGNILITDSLEPKIGDWGLSRLLGGATATDISGFSPRYAAPEQVDPSRFGAADERTDIYGAGCIFYELVTGVPPFTGEGIAEITGKILSAPPVLPSVLNPAAAPVDAIIMRCLEKEPGNRYQTAAGLEKVLMEFLGDQNPAT